MMKLVDMTDLKSVAKAYRFKSYYPHHAHVAELVDAPHLECGAPSGRVGSNPSMRTN
jgi:hypothetical protein